MRKAIYKTCPKITSLTVSISTRCFPAHKSTAKPAKEMQILQALTDNTDIESCFALALSKARKRVVVKRAARAALARTTQA